MLMMYCLAYFYQWDATILGKIKTMMHVLWANFVHQIIIILGAFRDQILHRLH
jgi:hypothetical protein